MSVAAPIVAFDTPAASPRSGFSLIKHARRIAARMLDAITEANERRASREIANFIARNGGMFTDEMERRIGERFSRS